MSIYIKPTNIATLGEKEKVIYADVNIGYNNIIDKEPELTNERAVLGSIYNILTTRRGSRISNPAFGSSLDLFLFKPVTTANGELLQEEVRRVLDQEPRITVHDHSIFVDKENNQYEITIAFTIPSLDEYYTTDITLGDGGVTMTSEKVYNN